MSALVPSLDLVRRASAIHTNYTRARLALLARIPGNPVGVEIRRVGEAYALSAPHLRHPGFNCVAGLRDEHAGEIPALIDWYQARAIAPTFEIIPGIDAPAVCAALAKAGFTPAGVHGVLYGAPGDAP